jgi:hypothetical protein
MHARRRLVVAAGLLTLSALASAPAIAQSGRHPVGARPAVASLGRNLTNRTFAGWKFTVKGGNTVSARFKVPALTCGKATTGIAFGVLMATGNPKAPHQSGAFLDLVCQGGKTVMQTVAFADCISFCSTYKSGSAPHLGDTMEVKVTSGEYVAQALIADLTPHHRFTLQEGANGAFGLLFTDLGADTLSSEGTQAPVVNFGTLSWSNGTITEGSTSMPIGSIPIGTTGREGYNMTTKTGVVKIKTGAIGGTANNTFTSTWKHS